MRFALILALLAAPIAVSLAVPSECFAQKSKQKPKKGAAKTKAPVKESKTAVPKEPEREEPVQKASDLVPVPAGELRGPTRIDFDDRLIQGQTNKSGAVYLFDRKETGINSMVRRRKSFRQLTLSTIYDR